MNPFKAMTGSSAAASPNPDRPPTILSEYGEGYCTRCRFVIGLTAQGRMVPHFRGRGLDAYNPSGKHCDGSRRFPAKVTPYSSRKSAFRIRVSMDTCNDCGRRVEVVDGALTWHSIFQYGGEKCPGSCKPVK